MSTDNVMVETVVVASGATEVEVVAISSLRLSENVIDNDVENDTGGVATLDEELLLRSPDKAVTEGSPKSTKSWADEAN